MNASVTLSREARGRRHIPEALGEEWKACGLISGGKDKEGFPMKQSVLTHSRVCSFWSKGNSCYRPGTGERKCKSAQRCIGDANPSVLSVVIFLFVCFPDNVTLELTETCCLCLTSIGSKGIWHYAQLKWTDVSVLWWLGPTRASRILKLFHLSKDDGVCQYVVRKLLNKEGKKPKTKPS